MMLLSRLAIFSLIIMTILLSASVLAKIWFPELLRDDFFEKIFMSYFIMLLSAWLISKFAGYLKKMETTSPKDVKNGE